MIASRRRYFAPAAAILIAAPLIIGLIAPDSPSAVLKEGRRLAPAPGWPASGAEWLGLPAALDAYLKDHFGLRQAMIRAHKDLTKPMLGAGSDSVLVGRDGRMFYLGEEAVRQSAGLVLRDERVAESVDLVVAMKAALAKRGVRFLVAVPPNSSTVYQDDLPDWAQNHGRRTEYDLFLDGLAARRVKTVDLRPVMAKARAEGAAYFRHDTHWTAFGALAAFNAVVEADGRPDWRLDPAAALSPPSPREGGDLARMLGVQDAVSEEVEELRLPEGRKQLMTADPYGDYWLELGPSGADDPDPRRLLCRRAFRAHAAGACRTRGVAEPRALRLRLGRDRQVPARRGVVDADRAVSRLRSGRAPARICGVGDGGDPG